MNVSQLMSQDPATCRLEEDLATAAGLMWDRDVGCLPVVGSDGRVVGMITDRDVAMAAYTQGRPLRGIAVSTAMSRDLFACLESDSLMEAEETMRSRKVRRLPVLDAHGQLLGVISLNDLALEAQRAQGKRARDLPVEEVAATLAAVCEHRQPGVLSIAA